MEQKAYFCTRSIGDKAENYKQLKVYTLCLVNFTVFHVLKVYYKALQETYKCSCIIAFSTTNETGYKSNIKCGAVQPRYRPHKSYFVDQSCVLNVKQCYLPSPARPKSSLTTYDDVRQHLNAYSVPTTVPILKHTDKKKMTKRGANLIYFSKAQFACPSKYFQKLWRLMLHAVWAAQKST